MNVVQQCVYMALLAATVAGTAANLVAQNASSSPDGRSLFATYCATCHDGSTASKAPAPDALKMRSPEAIVLALTNGSMRLQGSRIGGAERRLIAEYLTGRTFSSDVTGASLGRCPAGQPAPDFSRAPQWTAWGGTGANRRFQPASDAGLTPADVPRLTVKWVLGYPDATHAWSQPTIAGGRLFVGGQNGTVYALDAKSGCIAWTFVASGGVRTALTIAPRQGRHVVYFGDTNAVAYAVDAADGREIWRRKVDEHPLGRITGSIVVHEDRLFAPVSSYEEVDTASPDYECCTFRGSLVALSTSDGRVLWKTYTAGEPRPRGKSPNGKTLWGPSGAGIWSAPAVDARRRVVYAATGNSYSVPAEPTSDAVIAFDIASGAIKWVRQATPNDVYIGGCRQGDGNPNCPDALGPDYDFGNPPILTTRRDGKDIIVIGQKSGIGYALDPDDKGRILWQYRAGPGTSLGGMEYGSAVDDERAYFPLSGISQPNPGGLHAVDLMTGAPRWVAPPPPPVCASGRGCNAAQAAAVTVIPGVVFSGSNDGALRAFSTADGSILWTFDTNREFTTVNGVPGRGASILGPGPLVAGSMLYVNSGYGSHGGRAGNVLIAFGLE